MTYFSNFCKNKERGITIIEIVISIFIISILIPVVSYLLITVLQNPNQETMSMDNIAQAETVTSRFADEIRNSTTGNDGSYAINQAGASQIIFYSNFGDSGPVVSRIRYYLSGNTLYKGVVNPTGSPLSYNIASEIVSPVMSGVLNGSNDVFDYYDGNYNGTGSALSQPVNVNQIRFITMDLMIKNQTSSQSTGNFPITSGAAIRNLKDNLGD